MIRGLYGAVVDLIHGAAVMVRRPPKLPVAPLTIQPHDLLDLPSREDLLAFEVARDRGLVSDATLDALADTFSDVNGHTPWWTGSRR